MLATSSFFIHGFCSYMNYCYKIKLIQCIGKLHVFSHDDDDNDYYQDDDDDDDDEVDNDDDDDEVDNADDDDDDDVNDDDDHVYTILIDN